MVNLTMDVFFFCDFLFYMIDKIYEFVNAKHCDTMRMSNSEPDCIEASAGLHRTAADVSRRTAAITVPGIPRLISAAHLKSAYLPGGGYVKYKSERC